MSNVDIHDLLLQVLDSEDLPRPLRREIQKYLNTVPRVQAFKNMDLVAFTDEDDDGDVVWLITPRAYFEERGAITDYHLGLHPSFKGEEFQESTFRFPRMSHEEVVTYLGLVGIDFRGPFPHDYNYKRLIASEASTLQELLDTRPDLPQLPSRVTPLQAVEWMRGMDDLLRFNRSKGRDPAAFITLGWGEVHFHHNDGSQRYFTAGEVADFVEDLAGDVNPAREFARFMDWLEATLPLVPNLLASWTWVDKKLVWTPAERRQHEVKVRWGL